ncbi:MAG: Flp pilus assembly protein CpaB [Xanthobacteraceae bacterium]
MKAARIAVLVVAVGAGGVAALLMAGGSNTPSPPPAPVAQIDTVDVLIAKNDLGIGQTLGPQDVAWQQWPAASASSNFIRKSDRPDAAEQLTGAIARTPFMAGEPLRENRLIKGKGSGYMAAILPSGMRAISTEISAETGAGGFILPNDRVDVILSRRDREAEKIAGIEVHISETILNDVRVLAIDQTVEEKNGQRVVVGKTATLELTQRQSERLAVSRQLGTLTLALRSIADADPSKAGQDTPPNETPGGRTNMVRFGVTTTVTPR